MEVELTNAVGAAQVVIDPVPSLITSADAIGGPSEGASAIDASFAGDEPSVG